MTFGMAVDLHDVDHDAGRDAGIRSRLNDMAQWANSLDDARLKRALVSALHWLSLCSSAHHVR